MNGPLVTPACHNCFINIRTGLVPCPTCSTACFCRYLSKLINWCNECESSFSQRCHLKTTLTQVIKWGINIRMCRLQVMLQRKMKLGIRTAEIRFLRWRSHFNVVFMTNNLHLKVVWKLMWRMFKKKKKVEQSYIKRNLFILMRESNLPWSNFCFVSKRKISRF